MKNLTPLQKEIVEKMQAGQILIYHEAIEGAYVKERESAPFYWQHIDMRTVHSLEKKGVIIEGPKELSYKSKILTAEYLKK